MKVQESPPKINATQEKEHDTGILDSEDNDNEFTFSNNTSQAEERDDDSDEEEELIKKKKTVRKGGKKSKGNK